MIGQTLIGTTMIGVSELEGDDDETGDPSDPGFELPDSSVVMMAAAQLVIRALDGSVVEGATLEVFMVGADGDDDGHATIFMDDGTEVDQEAEPLSTDGDGVVRFRVAPGIYNLKVSLDDTIKYYPAYRIGYAVSNDLNSAIDGLPDAGSDAPDYVMVQQGGEWKRATFAQLQGWLT